MAFSPTGLIRRHEIGWQSVKFLFTGLLNTAVGYAIYLAGLFAGLLPELALAIATVLGALFNYFSTGRIVFGYSALDRLPRFMGAYAMVYVVNALALRGLITLVGHPAIVQAMLLPLMAATSFVIFRQFVFAKRAAA